MKAKDRREVTITIRCNVSDKKAWKECCAKAGTTMSEGTLQLIRKELEASVQKAGVSSMSFYSSFLGKK